MAENSDDYFETLSKVFQKNFSETEYFVPHFQQTLFDLQNESYKSIGEALAGDEGAQVFIEHRDNHTEKLIKTIREYERRRFFGSI